MKKQILMVVDYQYDFVAPQGVLPVPNAENIAENIQKEINSNKYSKIIYSFDTHETDEYNNSEEKELFPNIHCQYNTKGWGFYKIQPKNSEEFKSVIEKKDIPFSIVGIKNEEYFFTKNKFDIWEGSKVFPNFIEKSFNPAIYEITVVGVATNYCVFTNIMGWVKRGFTVNIKTDSVKGITHFPNGVVDESYENNISIMKQNDVNFI